MIEVVLNLKESCQDKHCWDAVRLASSEKTGTEVKKKKDVFVFELANDNDLV